MKKFIVSVISFILLVGANAYAADVTITDECADWSMVYEYSEHWTLSSSYSTYTGDDTTFRRKTAAYTASEPQYITYYNNNISKFNVTYFYTNTTAHDAISIWYSSDNVNFARAATTEAIVNQTSGSWNEVIISTGSLPKDTYYVKIQIEKNAQPTACAVGKVTYNAAETFDDYSKLSIDNFKFYQNGERIYTTPVSYKGKTAVTGVIHNSFYSIEVPVTVVAALYDEDGKLVYVNSQRVPGGIPPQSEKTFSIDIYDKYGTGSKLKVFFLDEINPVCTNIRDVLIEDIPEEHGVMVDTFEDFSKLYSYSRGFKIESGVDEKRFPGYTNRFMKTYMIPQSCKYYVPNAKSIKINAFLLNRTGNVKIYTSGYDGDYHPAEQRITDMTETGGAWYSVEYKVDSLPENTDFIKILLEDEGGYSFSLVLCRVEIVY